MNEEQALARRAVACKWWRWMAGMRSICPHNYAYRHNGKYHQHEENGPHEACVTQDKMCPDLTDPATLGCLLALVREAHLQAQIYAHPYGQGWRWRKNYIDSHSIYGSEIEALVAALEAAP